MNSNPNFRGQLCKNGILEQKVVNQPLKKSGKIRSNSSSDQSRSVVGQHQSKKVQSPSDVNGSCHLASVNKQKASIDDQNCSKISRSVLNTFSSDQNGFHSAPKTYNSVSACPDIGGNCSDFVHCTLQKGSKLAPDSSNGGNHSDSSIGSFPNDLGPVKNDPSLAQNCLNSVEKVPRSSDSVDIRGNQVFNSAQNSLRSGALVNRSNRITPSHTGATPNSLAPIKRREKRVSAEPPICHAKQNEPLISNGCKNNPTSSLQTTANQKHCQRRRKPQPTNSSKDPTDFDKPEASLGSNRNSFVGQATSSHPTAKKSCVGQTTSFHRTAENSYVGQKTSFHRTAENSYVGQKTSFHRTAKNSYVGQETSFHRTAKNSCVGQATSSHPIAKNSSVGQATSFHRTTEPVGSKETSNSNLGADEPSLNGLTPELPSQGKSKKKKKRKKKPKVVAEQTTTHSPPTNLPQNHLTKVNTRSSTIATFNDQNRKEEKPGEIFEKWIRTKSQKSASSVEPLLSSRHGRKSAPKQLKPSDRQSYKSLPSNVPHLGQDNNLHKSNEGIKRNLKLDGPSKSGSKINSNRDLSIEKPDIAPSIVIEYQSTAFGRSPHIFAGQNFSQNLLPVKLGIHSKSPKPEAEKIENNSSHELTKLDEPSIQELIKLDEASVSVAKNIFVGREFPTFLEPAKLIVHYKTCNPEAIESPESLDITQPTTMRKEKFAKRSGSRKITDAYKAYTATRMNRDNNEDNNDLQNNDNKNDLQNNDNKNDLQNNEDNNDFQNNSRDRRNPLQTVDAMQQQDGLQFQPVRNFQRSPGLGPSLQCVQPIRRNAPATLGRSLQCAPSTTVRRSSFKVDTWLQSIRTPPNASLLSNGSSSEADNGIYENSTSASNARMSNASGDKENDPEQIKPTENGGGETESSTAALVPGGFDSHCHLDRIFNYWKKKPTFHPLRSLVREFPELFGAKFEGCITVNCDPTLWEVKHWTWLTSDSNVWLTFGCHPNKSFLYDADSEDLLKKALVHPKTVALGEIGLDSFCKVPMEIQKQVFKRQLEIAKSMSLPVCLHIRGPVSLAIESDAILKDVLPPEWRLHMHCFYDSWEVCSQWIHDWPNMIFGITPDHYKEDFVAKLPMNKLILETDAPYFIPKSVKDEGYSFSVPGMVQHVAQQVAKIKNMPVNDVLENSRKNVEEIYEIPFERI